MSVSISGWKRVPPQVQKRCFELWIETGSLTKAQRQLTSEGHLNSQGRPYAVSQVSAQANTYILENFANIPIREFVDKDRERLGFPPLTDNEFYEYLINKAVMLWGTKTHVARFWDWIEEHNFERFSHLWKDRNIPPRPNNRPKR